VATRTARTTRRKTPNRLPEIDQGRLAEKS